MSEEWWSAFSIGWGCAGLLGALMLHLQEKAYQSLVTTHVTEVLHDLGIRVIYRGEKDDRTND